MSDKPNAIAILGVPVSAISMAGAIATIKRWIGAGRPRYVCVCDVHSIMRAQGDQAHMAAMVNADMVTPDGQPLVWTGRLRGESGMERVCGPDLLPKICEHSVREGWRHYFYGGAEGVAEKLARELKEKFPGLRIAGTECPPFRPQTAREKRGAIARINAAEADIVWVGLGCPKQEIWMHENCQELRAGVMIGVGAAFDFHTGRVKRAPVWMRARGLEWLHRLVSEPRRLWRRYLWLAPRFAIRSLFETALYNLRGRRQMG